MGRVLEIPVPGSLHGATPVARTRNRLAFAAARIRPGAFIQPGKKGQRETHRAAGGATRILGSRGSFYEQSLRRTESKILRRRNSLHCERHGADDELAGLF